MGGQRDRQTTVRPCISFVPLWPLRCLTRLTRMGLRTQRWCHSSGKQGLCAGTLEASSNHLGELAHAYGTFLNLTCPFLPVFFQVPHELTLFHSSLLSTSLVW